MGSMLFGLGIYYCYIYTSQTRFLSGREHTLVRACRVAWRVSDNVLSKECIISIGNTAHSAWYLLNIYGQLHMSKT